MQLKLKTLNKCVNLLYIWTAKIKRKPAISINIKTRSSHFYKSHTNIILYVFNLPKNTWRP